MPINYQYFHKKNTFCIVLVYRCVHNVYMQDRFCIVKIITRRYVCETTTKRSVYADKNRISNPNRKIMTFEVDPKWSIVCVRDCIANFLISKFQNDDHIFRLKQNYRSDERVHKYASCFHRSKKLDIHIR